MRKENNALWTTRFTVSLSVYSFFQFVKQGCIKVLEKYTGLLYAITGVKFSILEFLHGTHAMLAFIMAAFTVNISLELRLLFAFWFALSLYPCRKMKDE